MVGTIVNATAIVAGSSAGALFRQGIKEEKKAIMLQAIGLVSVSLGMTWVVNNITSSKEPLLFIISMVIGGLAGESLDIEGKVNRLGDRMSRGSGSKLIEGLTTAVLLFCVGTLSILGPIESALNGNHTLLFTNAMLDGITSMILASTFGIGIILAAGILFVWQGLIFMSAQFIAPFATPEIMGQISIVGGILIFGTGLNILEIKKIKTINMIPALAVPVIYYTPPVQSLVEWIGKVLL